MSPCAGHRPGGRGVLLSAPQPPSCRGIRSLIDIRVAENEESGKEYAVVARMAAESVVPVPMRQETVGVRPRSVVLLKATSELCVALATSDEELAELEAQDA